MIADKVRTDDDRPAAALRARGKQLSQPRRIILDTARASDGHPSTARRRLAEDLA